MKFLIVSLSVLFFGSLAAAQYRESFSEFDPQVGGESTSKVDLPSPENVQVMEPPPPEEDHAFTPEDDYKDKPQVTHPHKKNNKKIADKSSRKSKKPKVQTANHKAKASSRKLASINKKFKKNKRGSCT